MCFGVPNLLQYAKSGDFPRRVQPINKHLYPAFKPAYSGLLASSKDYYTIAKQKQCVPHAREVSGIPIRGNAHTWWGQAEGKYVRNDMPQPGRRYGFVKDRPPEIPVIWP